MKTLLLVLSLFLLAGCTSHIPVNIRQAPSPDLALATVASAVDDFKNQPVRWGGSILTVNNKAAQTEVEVLALPLDSSGKPVAGDQIQGRFLATLSGFYDPALFAQGRYLTLYGLLTGGESRVIGEKSYVYPVIAVQNHLLWPRETEYASGSACGYGYYRPYGYYRSGFYPGRFGYGFRGGYYRGYW